MNRRHYARELKEEEHAHHMTRRELAAVRRNISCVPTWVLKVCMWWKQFKTGV